MAYIEKSIPLGGANLNFKIVNGTTEPTNPSENMIWINTGTDIGEWQFSTTEPATRVDGTALQVGDVYMQTSNLSNIEFNVLKKNGLYLRLNVVCLYTDTGWINTVTYIYQNANWVLVDSNVYLYLNGNEYKQTTGGWVALAYGHSLATNYEPTITRDENNITFSLGTQTGSNGWGGTCATANDIDLTNINSIEFTISQIQAATYRMVSFVVFDRSKGYMGAAGTWSTPSYAAAYKSFFANVAVGTTYSLDTSDLSGEYAVGVFFHSAASAGTMSVTLSSIIAKP